MSNSQFANTPKPPYYAVIFSSQRGEDDNPDYNFMAQKMEELAVKQPGFLGVESARGADGFGITVSYWQSAEAIKNWKENAAHAVARRRGRQEWYNDFEVRVCKVERAYGKVDKQ